MTEDELNIKYIQETTGLVADDELVTIILSMLKEAYKSGLVQAEIDNTMKVIEENSNLQQRIDKAIEYIKQNSKICYSNKPNNNSIIGNFMWNTDKLLSILQGEEVK